MFPASHRRLERWAARAVATIAVGMLPWIVFLARTLPGRYQATHWNLLWVGFDAALVLVLASTVGSTWRWRRARAPLLLVAATMLVCDAWFDVVTSLGRRGGFVAVLTALAGELPLAAGFGYLYHRDPTRSVPRPPSLGDGRLPAAGLLGTRQAAVPRRPRAEVAAPTARGTPTAGATGRGRRSGSTPASGRVAAEPVRTLPDAIGRE